MGALLISSSFYGAIIQWNFERGEELCHNTKQIDMVPDVAFSTDGLTAFLVSLDASIYWIHANNYVRELDCDERTQYHVEPVFK